MITIVTGTSADSATVAALWNAKRLDAASCWYQAQAVDEAYVSQLLLAGFAFAIARADGSPVGFGLWGGPLGATRLVALAADDDETYYRLLGEFCDSTMSTGAQAGYAEIGTAPTTEKARMDALGAIAYVPIGYEPLLPGQDPAERVPSLLRAECNLQLLKDAVTQILEPTP